MSGTRFFDDLRMQSLLASRQDPPSDFRLQTGGRNEKNYRAIYGTFLAMLDDPNTKRLLFDARQAALFDELDDAPPMKGLIHPPFDQFYCEFTEPLPLAEQEPDHDDYARAFLFMGDAMKVELETEGKYEDGHLVYTEAQKPQTMTLAQVTLFLKEGDSFVDRTWKLNLATGMAFTPAFTVRESADPSVIPEWVLDDQYIAAGSGMPADKPERGSPNNNWITPETVQFTDRYVGWWERAIRSYSTLIMWIFAYTMAKSIHVVPEPVSRPQRRWHERKGLPLPWHITKVEPKFYEGRGGPPEPGLGGHHSYRYDVIGHLRFARHHTLHRPGFGTCPGEHCLREQVEWVSPHQRGLENTFYIPKTYKVERGKRISRRFTTWARGEIPVDEETSSREASGTDA